MEKSCVENDDGELTNCQCNDAERRIDNGQLTCGVDLCPEECSTCIFCLYYVVDCHSHEPSSAPSDMPTKVASALPSIVPTILTSVEPSVDPTTYPSAKPSILPSSDPTQAPSIYPTYVPSAGPSSIPSDKPSILPSSYPTQAPSVDPTFEPSLSPSIYPSSSPTASLCPISSATHQTYYVFQGGNCVRIKPFVGGSLDVIYESSSCLSSDFTSSSGVIESVLFYGIDESANKVRFAEIATIDDDGVTYDVQFVQQADVTELTFDIITYNSLHNYYFVHVLVPTCPSLVPSSAPNMEESSTGVRALTQRSNVKVSQIANAKGTSGSMKKSSIYVLFPIALSVILLYL